MTTYALNTGQYTDGATLQKAVGQQYHLGLSGPVGPGGANVFYGYVLEPDNSKTGGFRQRSDTLSKDTLTQYASPNLTDRDLAYFPRVTDGDFSGGGYQEVFIDPKRYFDSDLDPRIPGFLQLRAQWARVTKGGLTLGTQFQTVAFNGDFWFTFGESSGNVYSANAGTSSTPTAAAVLSLDTDGTYLYAGTATHLYRSPDGAAWTQVDVSLQGTATQWWIINQGTNGYFAYYQIGTNLLYKMDLTIAVQIPLANQSQVPVGSNAINIIDLVEYQTSIAILTTDVRGPGMDAWYFDGTNLTRIIRIEGYVGQGICNALGNLLVGAYAVGKTTSPELMLVSGGSFQVVAKPGSPFPTANQTCLQPRAASQYVYWPVITPSIAGISTAPGMVLQYDVLSGAVFHLPNQDTTDYTTTGGSLRGVALLGDNVAICYANGTSGILQYQTTAFASIKYQTSGWVVSSKIDFATPGITKRFRRIEVDHAPLNAGESVLVKAFVNSDPLQFTTALAANPASASVTNSTLGSIQTAMTFGVDTITKTMYFASQLTAGTGQLTTPRISAYAVEIGGTWVWELSLACTEKRRLLNDQDDQQGVLGKDLAYLLLLAYENGTQLTLYHRNGQSYTVTVESLELWTSSPKQQEAPQDIRDEPYLAHVTLRQVA